MLDIIFGHFALRLLTMQFFGEPVRKKVAKHNNAVANPSSLYVYMYFICFKKAVPSGQYILFLQ